MNTYNIVNTFLMKMLHSRTIMEICEKASKTTKNKPFGQSACDLLGKKFVLWVVRRCALVLEGSEILAEYRSL